MYYAILRDPKFYVLLFEIDADLAHEARSSGCPKCGGALHSAKYQRKPRGGPDLGEDFERRLSFCCAEEGCRRRRTPASVRFLGRKVYFGAVVTLVTAMQHGTTPERIAEIQALLGIGRRTLERWRTWWQAVFSASPMWRTAGGMLGAVDAMSLPLSLVERFLGDERARAIGTLRFVAPMTTPESGF